MTQDQSAQMSNVFNCETSYPPSAANISYSITRSKNFQNRRMNSWRLPKNMQPSMLVHHPHVVCCMDNSRTKVKSIGYTCFWSILEVQQPCILLHNFEKFCDYQRAICMGKRYKVIKMLPARPIECEKIHQNHAPKSHLWPTVWEYVST